MSSTFFTDFYLPVAKFISVIFLLYQVMLMLSAAYKINERLVGNVNKDTSKCSAIILVAFTLAVTGGYMAWIITSFMRFKCSKAVWW